MSDAFSPPGTAKDVENSTVFTPRFDASGLITAVVATPDGEILMLAMMNSEAVRLTLETGDAHFYSRSRGEIWHKGATSGNVLKVTEIRTDCDQDALWLVAEPQGHGAACHTGRKSCFYRRVAKQAGKFVLEDDGSAPLFDPDDVYRK